MAVCKVAPLHSACSVAVNAVSADEVPRLRREARERGQRNRGVVTDVKGLAHQN